MVRNIPVEEIVMLVGGVMVALGVFVWPIVFWGLRHARFDRELEHAERLRAIDCGTVLPKDKGPNPGVSIGVGVPSVAFGTALVATFFNAGLYAWPAAGAASIAAVICGTILALSPPPCPPHLPRDAGAKPALDPDALDTVSRRG